MKFNLKVLFFCFVVAFIAAFILSFDLLQNNFSGKEITIDSIEELDQIDSLLENDRVLVKGTRNNFFRAEDEDGNLYISLVEFKDDLVIKLDLEDRTTNKEFYGKALKLNKVDGYENLLEILNKPLQDFFTDISAGEFSEDELEKIEADFTEDSYILFPAEKISDQRVILIGEFLFSLIIFTVTLSLIFGGVSIRDRD